MWRWAWRVFSVLGLLAVLGGIAFVVVSEVRLHQEVRNICQQFSGIDCKHHPDRFRSRTPAQSPLPDALPSVRWNPETRRWEEQESGWRWNSETRRWENPDFP